MAKDAPPQGKQTNLQNDMHTITRSIHSKELTSVIDLPIDPTESSVKFTMENGGKEVERESTHDIPAINDIVSPPSPLPPTMSKQIPVRCVSHSSSSSPDRSLDLNTASIVLSSDKVSFQFCVLLLLPFVPLSHHT
jgi:hypothetical protein